MTNKIPTATIKNLKTWNTDDGGGYQGALHVDGKVAATFHNDGNGGPIEWRVADRARFTAWAASIGEPHPFDSETSDYVKCDSEADTALCVLIYEAEWQKRAKRLMRTKTLFRLPADKAGEYRTINHVYDAAVKAHLAKTHPDAVVLNEAVR